MTMPYGNRGSALSSVPYEDLTWVIPHVVAFGHTTALFGPNGSGRKTLASYIAARISAGSSFGSTPLGPALPVMIWASTIHKGVATKRRLVGAGCDEGRIELIGTEKPFEILHDLPELLVHVNCIDNPTVIVIESTRILKGKDNERHRAWQELTVACSRRHVALLVCAEAKRRARGLVADRCVDKALSESASMIFNLAAETDEEGVSLSRRVAACTKRIVNCSWSGYEFFLGEAMVANLAIPSVTTLYGVEGTAEQIFEGIDAPVGVRAQHALRWLHTVIPPEGIWVEDLRRKAREDGVSRATIRRVKDRAGVEIQQVANRSIWRWRSGYGGRQSWQINTSGNDWGASPSPGEGLFGQQVWSNGFAERSTPRWAHGQAGQAGQPGQPGQVGQAGQAWRAWQRTPINTNEQSGVRSSPEMNASHPEHASIVVIVTTAFEELMDSRFEPGGEDPRLIVIRDVVRRHAPQWSSRLDLHNAMAELLPILD